MKKITLIVLLIAFAVVGVQPATAQTATTQTVTSAAITLNATNITVASATGISASTQSQEYDVWIDGELMKVNTVNGTTLGVTRGRAPTKGSTHATASIVWFGPVGNTTWQGGTSPFTNQNPQPGSVCVRTAFAFMPIMNVGDGSLSNCLAAQTGGNRWIAYNFRQWAYGHPLVEVIDAAYTATLADEFVDFNSMTATRILTLPSITGVAGKTIVVLNGSVASQSITITPVVGQTIGPGSVTTLAQAGAGTVTRLISTINSAGAWQWKTW